ncbi:putative leucine-rich repeat receptor-like protein kinase, partial [Mucuna pruriens]
AALLALQNQWQNTPPNWVNSDPCDGWDGIECYNSRIISISLASMDLSGELTSDIGSLSELLILDLSYNKNLTGPLPSGIGNLKKLRNLLLINCGFTGPIPDTIGNLEQLVFLSLNSNSFSGRIPPAIGNLSNIYWLDLAENQLEGPIPISNGTTPGLDMMHHTRHFHFGKNRLSGNIPSQLFSPEMSLIHVLFESNAFTGSIPSTLGLVKTLEVVRFDGNYLSGPLPPNINNLTNVRELFLSNNRLSGSMPNLTGMNVLSYLLSTMVVNSSNSDDNNDGGYKTSRTYSCFFVQPVTVADSVSNAQSLNTVVAMQVIIPVLLFHNDRQAKFLAVLKNNQLNGTLDVGASIGNQLNLLDLQTNFIDKFDPQIDVSKVEIILVNNPICQETGAAESYCSIAKSNDSYTTPPNNCVPVDCSLDQTLSPNCKCAYPYTGTLTLRAPSFSDLENKTVFQTLESSLMNSFQQYDKPVDSVSLSNPRKDRVQYLNVTLKIFPLGQDRFNRIGISGIGFIFSNQSYKPPPMFGPYVFIADPYENFMDDSEGPATSSKSSNTGIIAGAAAGGSALLVLVLLACVYALSKKKNAKTATGTSNPFEKWDPEESNSSIPQLKGARRFSFEEIQNYTKNFSQVNNIGSGGYGKVYRGTLPNGQLIAVKRAQKESMQGGLEFKTEIELLSRVHHKNLVSLIGFCYEQGEQMLIYEYVANGTLKDTLSGKSGIRLDWIRRLKIALGAARGLDYLHELANPPIIHRDIKSTNILLDERLNAKVSDFGLSKPLGEGAKGYITTQVKGTMGYLDPEYYMTQQLTEKSDVYSFGVLMLELITARRPIERGKYIVKVVKSAIDKTKNFYGLDEEILDPTIELGTALSGLGKYVDLAMQCVEESSSDRPTMNHVVKEIENLLQLAGSNPILSASASTSSSYNNNASKGSSHHPYDNEYFDSSVVLPLVVLKSLRDSWQASTPTWMGSDPCNSWDGIKCKNSRVSSMDLSYNRGLTGPLPPEIGNLKKLKKLILVGCGFTGHIPDEIGSLQQLVFLSLNSNSFDGPIPPSIGNLSNLTWLDLADNMLDGPIPVSSGTTPGLDMLHNTQHLRFENNSLDGYVPQSLNNLTNVTDLLLSQNKLQGALPNLAGMNSLVYLDLSNNSFDEPSFPLWLSNMENLTTLQMENVNLNGKIPVSLFSLARNNNLGGTLDIGTNYSKQLQLIDLKSNSIQDFEQRNDLPNNTIIILVFNPICTETEAMEESYCMHNISYYREPQNKCLHDICNSDQILSPKCKCGYPYMGTLIFRAPSFFEWRNKAPLEEDLLHTFQSNHLPVDSVSLTLLNEDPFHSFEFTIRIFPSGQDSFNQQEKSRISFLLGDLSANSPYNFITGNRGKGPNESSKSSSIVRIIGAAVGGSSVLLVLLVLAGNWDPNKSNCDTPQLKAARQFSFKEIKKYTNNFSQANDIGSGGYGKVYRGTLPSEQVVAIKRAQKESKQGGPEFKAEIELLSRVHHKNLVKLVGFCFEREEQMLVYEFVSNGTLKDALTGKSGIVLSWSRRLKVALGAARGLAYLHEHADPPIIHRDIKSNNILLDDNYTAKVADFGLSKSILDDGKDHVTTQVKGTMGYLDPDYYTSQQLTEKSDVYSFGVLMLELITARKPIERGKYIVKVVKNMIDKAKHLYGLHEIIDPAICSGSTLEGFEKFVDLAMECLQESGADRPTMSDVVKEIEDMSRSVGLNLTSESVASPSSSDRYQEDTTKA